MFMMCWQLKVEEQDKCTLVLDQKWFHGKKWGPTLDLFFSLEFRDRVSWG